MNIAKIIQEKKIIIIMENLFYEAFLMAATSNFTIVFYFYFDFDSSSFLLFSFFLFFWFAYFCFLCRSMFTFSSAHGPLHVHLFLFLFFFLTKFCLQSQLCFETKDIFANKTKMLFTVPSSNVNKCFRILIVVVVALSLC